MIWKRLQKSAVISINRAFVATTLIATIVGSTVLLGSMGALIVIDLAEKIKPNQKQIEFAAAISATISGFGIVGYSTFLLAKRQREIQFERKLQETQNRNLPESCTQCKFYCSNPYLRCAVHPELTENCPDWEQNRR
ncbi:hypothetical protein [Fischerella sp. PCC 9605]|uniref:hypothetical protein n=1 Tax=Fischerella sp. PCC 9605 TaxID=1173024 RepID=UPI0004790D91|nr:hypothetical protein [Fischerella sp. PCC 9605]